MAFFPLIRGRHSVQATAKIQDTTQLFLDVYSDSRAVYVRPEKVWNRESETMFLPHQYDPETGAFQPLLDGVQLSRFYKVMNSQQRPGDVTANGATLRDGTNRWRCWYSACPDVPDYDDPG